MVYVFLADGFEIIEAMSPIDMLKRANVDVKTVGITGNIVESSCGIKVITDISTADVDMNIAQAIILPGGGLGTENLDNSLQVKAFIEEAIEKNIYVCAICAAPSILGKRNILKGKKATSFPSFQKYLYDAELSDDYVVTDGKIITARGAGVSVDFGLEIVKNLVDEQVAEDIRKSIQCQ